MKEKNIKADPRPTTDEWFAIVLAIKDFGEKHDMQLSDTQYGWLATLYFDLMKPPTN